jgi:predicted unusual protein kinase regulating ubiquinone biosynthesis (AarF/ABC1/UbiB family)
VQDQYNQSANPEFQALERVGVSKDTRKYLRNLQKLCGASGVLPRSFFLAGELEEVSKRPFDGGSFADIYKATYEGQKVVVKVLRTDTLSGDLMITRKVRILCIH